MQAGKAPLFLQCAGQANSWLEELRKAYFTCPSARSLILECVAVLKEELATAEGRASLLDEHSFDVLGWITGQSPLHEARAFCAPVSYPMILLTQLASYAVILCHLNLEQGAFIKLLRGVAGHSQGILAAVTIASSKTLEDLVERSKMAFRAMLWHGARVQSVADALYPFDPASKERPMLLIRGISRQQAASVTGAVNTGVPSTHRVFLSLENADDLHVVSGYTPTLAKLKKSLDADFRCAYLSTSCPFHSPLLEQVSLDSLYLLFSRQVSVSCGRCARCCEFVVLDAATRKHFEF